VATVSTKPGGVVTSVIETTTYVCPTPGTYTIAPITTVVVSETLVVYPVVTTYCPGTYTAPAVITTITETATVIYCPFATPTPAATTSVPALASEKPVPSKPAANPGKLGGTGDHWAMTYTPYTNDAKGDCKSAAQVLADLKAIKEKGFTTIRVYSTDCNTLEHVGAACEELKLKMIIGVFIREKGCESSKGYIAEQITAITTWAKWGLVELIVVGNECLHNNLCTPDALKQLIIDVKSACTAKGYTGPFTTAETVDQWQKTSTKEAICGVIDLVGGQIHPYFNAETTPEGAGKFVAGQLAILEGSAICGTKDAINLECGWPSAGHCNGLACPGSTEQATAIASIKAAIGWKVVFFSFTNDAWKADGNCGCEKYWGCGELFG
jgi:exo-beta-1,3-glucanase (GH17 family)